MTGSDTPERSVILAGARTPIGRFRGALATLPASSLGSLAIRSAVDRSGVPDSSVQYVVMGQVVTAGAGQNPARIAAIAAGLPLSVPAVTLNKVCLAGLDAIATADALIRAGEYDVVVAGGMESMSLAPHLLPAQRGRGGLTVHDSLELDGLFDNVTNQSMGLLTEQANTRLGIGRIEQDNWAAGSHLRAARAWKDGRYDHEVVPVSVPQRRGESLSFAADEGFRTDTNADLLAGLAPAFAPDGTITAGNCSPLSDGAAAVVITSRRYAQDHGLPWLATIEAQATVAGPDTTLQHQPAAAIRRVCSKTGLRPTDLDLLEINEAFAAVAVASTDDLGVNPERVNVDGGAIALGHPLGMSGARITLHLALMLAHRGGGTGVAALCGGGGQGQALLLTANLDDHALTG